jgi:hypothetical protein
LPTYYSLDAAPGWLATRRMLLRRLLKLKKKAKPQARVAFFFANAWRGRAVSTALPPAQIAELQERLTQGPPGGADVKLIDELLASGQAVYSPLYDASQADPITSFTDVDARELLGLMVFDGSHPEDYIIEATVRGERQRRTWTRSRSTPDLLKHLRGERMCGPKRGESGRLVTVDLDRHSDAVSAEYHTDLVLETSHVLAATYPRLRFAPEVNGRNGSSKCFGWGEKLLPTDDVVLLAEDVRATLAREIPRHDWARVEIYPANSPQVFAPLRPDKVTVIGSGRVGTVPCRRYEVVSGKRKLIPASILSPAQYLNWVYFEKSPPSLSVLADVLKAACANCPDRAPSSTRTRARRTEVPPCPRPVNGSGMGDIGSMKGRAREALVDFWGGKQTPPADTINKLLVVTLRVLRYEGLPLGEALAWVEGRLARINDTSFSDRLTDDKPELLRMTKAVAERVWRDNGYQADSQGSEKIFADVVSAWGARGFRLHDPATWDAATPEARVPAAPTEEPPLTLDWTPRLEGLLPRLAVVAKTDLDGAKAVMETILVFVARHSELAKPKVGTLLSECGIKGRSQGKQHKVRKFFVDEGLIVLHKNYVSDKASKFRHGNFYFLGPEVRFQESDQASPPTPHTPVSTYYPSFSGDREGDEYKQEARRLACEKRFRKRRRPLCRAAKLQCEADAPGESDLGHLLAEAFEECFGC